MKRTAMTIILVLSFLVAATASAEQASPKVVDMANTKLAGFGSDAVIVAAVKAQNAKGQTLDQVKARDAEWLTTAGIADYMQAMMDSECGKHLRGIQNGMTYISEIFVMDTLGANVAMTDKTSDYWQGDEAKFQKSYANGAGAIFVDDVKFDDSAQAYLVQVSVPVTDGGKAIGAITFGINVDKID